ncbi:hypothetical protein PROFUN_04787 [Planoprotostelium fungivorum]|uniref:Transmembrane protein n=1 Tax=Planoprotostelium fungivorum TaxID=1890364 RepID=A0A2P6NSX3_9EUKA|nr:hypothetical protein PROFUN_04787 [Planoprotostelium fungivorum]
MDPANQKQTELPHTINDLEEPANRGLQMRFASVPPRTKMVCAFLLGTGTLFSLLPSVSKFFTMAPGRVLPPNFYIWTVFTSGFIEPNIITAFFNAFFLFAAGGRLESIWGAVEFIRFLSITNVLTSVSTFFFMMLAFPFSNPDKWMYAQFSGFSAAVAGIAVANKQLFPEASLGFTESPFFGLRAKHLPFILIFFNTLPFFFMLPFHNLLYTLFGILISWTYLRFYQVRVLDGTNKVVGDLNDSFNFSSFFPDRIAPFVQILGNTVYSILKTCNCCRTAELSHENLTNRSHNTDNDAERRRAKALKSLDQRLQLQQEFTIQPGHHTQTPTATEE